MDTPEDAPAKKLVKLSVTIDEAEFDRDIDMAFRTIAKEVKLPGFRQGKVPRKVLEARIGLATAREQALRDAVPQYLANAVREHDIDLIATPNIEFTAGQESGPVSFDATCEVRPEITVPGYGGLRVELTSPVATEADIDEAVEAELRRQGSLVDVDRPVQSGDQVTINLAGTRDGEPVAGLNTEDWLYQVGAGWVAPGFDGELLGANVGDELKFTATPNGTNEEADFVVEVLKVQETVLPELTDEWVSENLGEFETIEEWRAALAERIGTGKLNQTRNQFIERTTSSLAGLVEIEPPESMVQADLQGRVQNTVQQFQAQGISIDQWLQVTGQDPAAFIESLKVQSEKAVKVDLALRAVGVAEGLEVTDDDINAEYARIALQVRQKASEVRKAYERNDAVTDLVAQMRKNKALDWLLEHVEIVDEAGEPIDRDLVIGKNDDHDHGDHDHDHGDGDHDHDHHDHADHDHDHEGHDHD
ncbi:MAG TPA: trigger factor [Ilumatobacteraceae bacterium]|nr:trigger factor [Ilumatobacteraceae bacterium]